MCAMYAVSWTEENWYEVMIEADSEHDAVAKFKNKDYDPASGMMIEKNYINRVKKIDDWVV